MGVKVCMRAAFPSGLMGLSSFAPLVRVIVAATALRYSFSFTQFRPDLHVRVAPNSGH